MPEKQRTPWEELRLVARTRTFRHEKEMAKSLGWLKSHEPEYIERVANFTSIIAELNNLMACPEELPPEFRDVRNLQSSLNGVTIPSFSRAQQDYYFSKAVNLAIANTLKHAQETYPSWAQVNPNYPSPATPAIGALVEGFGHYLGNLVYHANGHEEERQRLNREFVLAFEEVLLINHSSSPIINDVIGWMIEEQGAFPPEFQVKLEEYLRGN